jgi:SH3-like domain-containing protein
VARNAQERNATMNRLALVVFAVVAFAGCRAAFQEPPTAKVGTAPQPAVSATVTRESALRSGPHASAAVLQTVASGTAVTASEEVVRGFRRVKTADGKSGYVAQEAVEVSGAAAAAAAAPAAAPAAPVAPAAPAEQGGAAAGQ